MLMVTCVSVSSDVEPVELFQNLSYICRSVGKRRSVREHPRSHFILGPNRN